MLGTIFDNAEKSMLKARKSAQNNAWQVESCQYTLAFIKAANPTKSF